MTLDAILDELQPITGSSIRVTRDETALTNSIYRITSHTGDWCLRINNPKANNLGINRKRERVTLDSIKHQTWAPNIVAQQEDYLFSHWSNGIPFHPTGTSNTQDNLDLLASTLIEIQQTVLNEVTHPLKIDHQLNLLISQLPSLAINFKQSILGRLTYYQPPDRYVLCHHDWHRDNVLIHSKQLTVLDWEYAALGDPAVELHCIAEGFDLTIKQTLYLAEQLGLDINRIESIQPLVQAMSILWYLIRFPNDLYIEKQQQWLRKWAL